MEMAIAPSVKKRMRWRALGYGWAFIGIGLGAAAMLGRGLWCWSFPLFAFVVIPTVELLSRPDASRLTDEEAWAALQEPLYDVLVYLIVPLQWTLLVLFLLRVDDPSAAPWETAGRVATMGLLCGVYGINVAHELGHRAKRWERDLARALLLTSLYMHFLVEHNRGHHRHVATPMDPASARFGEPIYLFWPRTVVMSFLSAWRIEVERLRSKGLAPYGPHNEVLQGLVLEGALVLTIGLVLGVQVLLYFLMAAFIGILLLELVNYIEHYGLQRRKRPDGTYGRVQHVHSWNSDHVRGRLMLFELTRHSDHHYKASKKYQVLASVPESPQLPTGYPGMMLLSLVPPLWFRVVDPRLRALARSTPELDLALN